MRTTSLLMLLLATGLVPAAEEKPQGPAKPATPAASAPAKPEAPATAAPAKAEDPATAAPPKPEAPAPAEPGKSESAPAAAPAQPERRESEELGMSILGNQEAPKALVIVPWKSSELGTTLGMAPLLDDSRQPVDREVFLRALSYYEIRSGRR